MREIKLIADTEQPMLLKSFLTGRKGVSKRTLARLKREEGGITRGGAPLRSTDTVLPGDEIVLRLGDTSFLEPNPGLCVPIAFENDSLVVFDKPAGMPVHPSVHHQGDTLGNYFAHLYPDTTFRPVSRLDCDTSGLCLIARDAHSAKLLQGACSKVYYAAVHGEIPESGTIDAPIAREHESIILRCVREDGRSAVTHYRRLGFNGRYSLAEVRPETGRTHQIRVHFAHIGHPLAGDEMYGGLRTDIARHALHCAQLRFTDPMTGDERTVISAIPADMEKLF